jgi:hypothetical protein
MRETIPEALQPWYCNNAGAAGKAMPNARCLDFLVKFGPQYRYFPEPCKSYYICKAEDEDTARQAFESFGLNINYSRGQRYLGGFIGSAEKKEEWLVGMVEKWAAAVVTLSTVAERYPQTAYAEQMAVCPASSRQHCPFLLTPGGGDTHVLSVLAALDSTDFLMMRKSVGSDIDSVRKL